MLVQALSCTPRFQLHFIQLKILVLSTHKTLNYTVKETKKKTQNKLTKQDVRYIEHSVKNLLASIWNEYKHPLFAFSFKLLYGNQKRLKWHRRTFGAEIITLIILVWFFRELNILWQIFALWIQLANPFKRNGSSCK